MAWFRLHEGTYADAKWPIIARKANTNVGTVVSIWIALLDYASQHEQRGSLDDFDPETIDALYGYEDGTCQSVVDAMICKGMISDDRVVNWEKRQPLKEDSTRQERKERYNERYGTPKNAPDKIREDKIREDKNIKIQDSFCAELSGDTSTHDKITTGSVSQNSPPVIALPLNTGEAYPVTQDMVNKWQELYPAVDVLQQLRNMLGWLEANSSKRKTKNGILKFINRWLADKQDKGGSPRASPPAPQPEAKQSEGDRAAQKTWESYKRLQAKGLVS